MYAKYMKRLLDILLSLTILVVLSPLLLVLCILVRSKLGSPIFFKQERPGLHEKIFTMYKFRTMTDKRDAEEIFCRIRTGLPNSESFCGRRVWTSCRSFSIF